MKKLTREQRQNLFSAELKLASIYRHISNRNDSVLPESEREGMRKALQLVGFLYWLVRKQQEVA